LYVIHSSYEQLLTEVTERRRHTATLLTDGARSTDQLLDNSG
jgi:hypothetical protein